MNKELTPLEVSKQLKDFVLEFVKNGLDRRVIRGSFDFIETELERLEEIDKHLYLNNKKIKALKIIKEKEVNVGYLMSMCFNAKNGLWLYNAKIAGPELTQEEYDLLKRTLL